MEKTPRVHDGNTSSSTDQRATKQRPNQRNDSADDRDRRTPSADTDSSASRDGAGENTPAEQTQKNDL